MGYIFQSISESISLMVVSQFEKQIQSSRAKNFPHRLCVSSLRYYKLTSEDEKEAYRRKKLIFTLQKLIFTLPRPQPGYFLIAIRLSA